MLTDLIELGWKMKKTNEGYQKWNKAKYSGNQQLQEGNQDSNQWFGTKEINIQLEQNEGTRIQKKWETFELLGQLETFQHANYKGARKRRTTARNWKLIWTNNEGKLPQSLKGNRLLGNPENPESPKEVGPKEEHKAHHH